MKIGLALSGGALRGIFHLGVIEALEELKIPIHALSGSSSGSIVAVLYAAGHSPKDILKIATSSSILKILNLKPWAGGLLSHSHLSSLLKLNLKMRNLEELDRPVFVTATNLRTGQLDVFSTGEIIPIVTASSAIPVMFNPIKVNGEMYLDGGLMMNMPVSPLLPICDKVIAVNLIPEIVLNKGQLNNFLKIIQRTFDLTVLNNIKPELELASLTITMDALNEVNRISWSGMKEVYEMGYTATMESADKVTSLLQ